MDRPGHQQGGVNAGPDEADLPRHLGGAGPPQDRSPPCGRAALLVVHGYWDSRTYRAPRSWSGCSWWRRRSCLTRPECCIEPCAAVVRTVQGSQNVEGLPPDRVGDDGGLRGENQRMGPGYHSVPALGTPIEVWAWWGKEPKRSSAVVTPW